MASSFLVFVYGTLKRWHRNNILLRDSVFVGNAVTCRPLYMYSYDIPIVSIPCNSETAVHALPIIGEVYSVSKRVLRQLDILEGHPDVYFRTLEKIQIEDRNRKAYIYVRSGKKWSLSKAERLYNEKKYQEGIRITDNKYEWIGSRVN